MISKFILLAAAFLLASCVAIERDNPDDPKSDNYIKKGGLSSSSLVASGCKASDNTETHYCSNGTMKEYGFVTYGTQTYKTVEIGTQTWMAENLNYAVEGSKCYDDDENYCDMLGRLYDWSMAMALPSSCNTSTCSSLINAKHRGICPEGWHIPSDADWNVLMKFINPSCSDNSDCAYAGTMLKSVSGWINAEPIGKDYYGFSALPGGGYFYYSNADFGEVGYSSYWWSANEYNGNSDFWNDSNDAYCRHIGSQAYEEKADRTNLPKKYLSSVRCVNDVTSSSSSLAQSSSSATCTPADNNDKYYCINGTMKEYDFVTDDRDGQDYKTVKIGSQTWMAENLNYETKGGKCYGENRKVLVLVLDENGNYKTEYITLSNAEIQANCDKYGRLYDWATAMALPSSCNSSNCASQVGTKHRGICPSGWYIPSNADWNVLMKSINPRCSDNSDCINAGTKLKSVVSWDTTFSILYPKGTDDYGFSALPSGEGSPVYSVDGSLGDSTFSDVGKYGGWWSSSENTNTSENSIYRRFHAYHRYVRYDNADAVWNYQDKNHLDGVRCVKD